jgi:hypothetical protein
MRQTCKEWDQRFREDTLILCDKFRKETFPFWCKWYIEECMVWNGRTDVFDEVYERIRTKESKKITGGLGIDDIDEKLKTNDVMYTELFEDTLELLNENPKYEYKKFLESRVFNFVYDIYNDTSRWVPVLDYADYDEYKRRTQEGWLYCKNNYENNLDLCDENDLGGCTHYDPRYVSTSFYVPCLKISLRKICTGKN